MFENFLQSLKQCWNDLVADIRGAYSKRGFMQPVVTGKVQSEMNPVQVEALAGPIKYYLSDPAFPDLVIDVAPPGSAALPFQVPGYAGGGFPLGSAEAQCAECQVALTNSINYVVNHTKSPLTHWAATGLLQVIARAGKMFNAYYDRSALRFFYDADPVSHKMVFTSEASPVITHELGHAILDAIRPDLWGSATFEGFAFHEAFGDCNAILHIMLYDEILNHAQASTGGNLRQSNVISQLAVEMGTAIAHLQGRQPGALRDAVNSFVWVAPESLPRVAAPEALAQEPHSFSRVWTGTFYEIFVNIYERLRANSDPLSAMKIARDVCADYLFGAVAMAPAVPRFFESVATAMLAVDASRGGPYADILRTVFANRHIIGVTLRALSDTKINDLKISLHDEVLKNQNVIAVRLKNVEVLKLVDRAIVPQDNNPLYDVEIEVTKDKFYQFNAEGNLENEIAATDQEVIDAALAFVQFLHEGDHVGDGDRPFKVESGKLVRKHYNCDTFIVNSELPGAPEFGKPWKAANNSGCCGGGGCPGKSKPQPEPTPVKRGCYVRVTTGGGRVVRTGSNVRIKVC
jgi:hypothetical protein